MPRLYRKAKSKRPEVMQEVWDWLCDENPDTRGESGGFSFEIFKLYGEWVNHHGDDNDQLRKLWEEIEADVLDYFVALHPGHRPRMWWRYSAPRVSAGEDAAAGTYLCGKLAAPRLQISGAGGPPWKFGFAILPAFENGLPGSWVCFDPEDPPVFESEASYLRGHGLLTPGEARKLTAEDFEPVAPDIPEDEVLTEMYSELKKPRCKSWPRSSTN